MFIQPGQFTEEELPIASVIQRRRLQLLIHSFIYYELNKNIVSDHEFDRWSKELVTLQADNPELLDRIVYAEAFNDWDGSTGAYLPYKDPWVVSKAYQLLEINGGFNEHKKIQQSARIQSSQPVKRQAPTKQRGNSLF